MRALLFVTSLSLFAACGDDGKKAGNPDAPVTADAATSDAATDAPATDANIDAQDIDAVDIDAPQGDGIAEVRAAANGDVTLDVRNVTVTYLKPALGNSTNDPAGFTVQSQQMGPGLFVSVDPSTLSPPAVVGDVVSFQVTTKGTVGLQPRAQAITSWTRHSQGANVSALAQNISAATDVLSAIDNYDSELVTVTGTLAQSFAGSGSGFQRAAINTAGIMDESDFQFRVPATLVDALDLANTCTVTATNVPMGRYEMQAQIGAFVASDFTLSNCPAPTVTDAIALSPTSVRVTFSRRVLASSFMADGSQFTFDNNLTASAATLDGRTVTLTTSQQTGGTTYTVTAASSLTDLQGTAIGTPSSDTFNGYLTAAVLKINEINANIDGNCDLIELRAVSGGPVEGFKLMERTAVLVTLPAITLQPNDIVVVHFGGGNTGCNPAGATNEMTSKTQFPVAMHSQNYDTAYDLYTTAMSGLTRTNNVFTLKDATNAIQDAVFTADGPSDTTAGGTETQAAAVGAANQWSPMLAAYEDDVFYMHAVQDLDGTGTSSTGTTIQRINDNDTNSKADWTTGAGAAQTWGLLNVGQQ